MLFKSQSSKELLAIARSIHFAMQHGKISYQEAEEKTRPLLDLINAKMNKIAQKYDMKPKKIKFQDLGRSF